LVIALGIASWGQGKKVLCFRVTELMMTTLLEAREECQLLWWRGHLAKLDLLILDGLLRLLGRLDDGKHKGVWPA
jgi:hypothetical protein